MELLIGMLLLLQVFVSIQIMLMRRQVLHQSREQSAKIDLILESISVHQRREENDSVETDSRMNVKELQLPAQGETADVRKQKDAQENLINEVLSEVFS